MYYMSTACLALSRFRSSTLRPELSTELFNYVRTRPTRNVILRKVVKSREYRSSDEHCAVRKNARCRFDENHRLFSTIDCGCLECRHDFYRRTFT